VNDEHITVGLGTYGDLHVIRADVPGARIPTVRVGAFCSFGPNVRIVPGSEHNIDWVTTFPFGNTQWHPARIEGHPKPGGDVVIGNDVWVGMNTLILAGTTIEDGAVIGAGSVVKGYVAPYTIHTGNPLRRIGARFEPDVVKRLLALRWWEWPAERVRRAIPNLSSANVREFLEAAERGEL
jgi:acetyltransferase-like isoleucine patch superfamily enzyme